MTTVADVCSPIATPVPDVCTNLPALRGLRLQPCACSAARCAGGERLAAGQAVSRTGERLRGGFRWRGVGDRVGVRRRWKRPFNFPILLNMLP
jgi:hypothetical protein